MSMEMYDTLPEKDVIAKRRTRKWAVGAQNADGRKLRPEFQAKFIVDIGGKRVTMEAHVASRFAVPMLWGTNVLDKWGAIIDVSTGSVRLETLDVNITAITRSTLARIAARVGAHKSLTCEVVA